MKTPFVASVLLSVASSVALAESVAISGPVKLMAPQMDSITAGAVDVGAKARAISHKSTSTHAVAYTYSLPGGTDKGFGAGLATASGGSTEVTTSASGDGKKVTKQTRGIKRPGYEYRWVKITSFK